MIHGRCQCLRRKCGSVRIGSDGIQVSHVVPASEGHHRPQRIAYQYKIHHCCCGLRITASMFTKRTILRCSIPLSSGGYLWPKHWCITRPHIPPYPLISSSMALRMSGTPFRSCSPAPGVGPSAPSGIVYGMGPACLAGMKIAWGNTVA
jgi:hypothetical protein